MTFEILTQRAMGTISILSEILENCASYTSEDTYMAVLGANAAMDQVLKWCTFENGSACEVMIRD